MAAPLKSAKGKSLTVSFPRDGFFAPFRARWRDRRAADLMPEMRTGKSAESRIPGGDPEPPPQARPWEIRENPVFSWILSGNSQKSPGFSGKFPEIPRILQNSQDHLQFFHFLQEIPEFPSIFQRHFCFLGYFYFLNCFFLEFSRNSSENPRSCQQSPGKF